MFKDFKTYQLAKKLYLHCQKLKLKSHMKNQLDRASLSIVLNIAEGSGKLSMKDRARFYQIALGSLRKTYAILDILNEINKLKDCEVLAAHLWKLIQNPGP
ncbi:MAG: four helix bundle protein [Halobacteriovoraceae bacterium]|nr:four helix bundle protein [Halobacteriovoraceae bacterium]MCB9095464.1 four helix bundle protein [Halobacteriovoraceae bacterium]